MYVALGLCDKYVRTRVNRMDQWLKRRKIVIAITTIFRVVGVLAGIALGAYYASRKDGKLAAAAALGFVFAVACIIAIAFTWVKKIEQPVQSKEAMGRSPLLNRRQGLVTFHPFFVVRSHPIAGGSSA